MDVDDASRIAGANMKFFIYFFSFFSFWLFSFPFDIGQTLAIGDSQPLAMARQLALPCLARHRRGLAE